MNKYKKVKLIYMGRRIRANKLRYLYSYTSDNGTADDSQFTFASSLGTYPVGAIIEVFENENDGSFKSECIGIGIIKDKIMLSAWEVEDLLNYSQHQSQQHWKKLSAGQSKYELIINDLNVLLKSLPKQQRKAFVFKLISDIDFDI